MGLGNGLAMFVDMGDQLSSEKIPLAITQPYNILDINLPPVGRKIRLIMGVTEYPNSINLPHNRLFTPPRRIGERVIGDSRDLYDAQPRALINAGDASDTVSGMVVASRTASEYVDRDDAGTGTGIGAHAGPASTSSTRL